MNTTELVAQVRAAATIEDQSTEYTAAIITQLLNQSMTSVFEPLIAGARSGYWLHALTRSLSVGNPYVRLHPRACALEQIDIRQTSGDWKPLTEALESELQDWPQRDYQCPQVYVVRGNTIVLQPAATATDLELRTKVTARPSVLVTEQTAGRIVAVDTTARTLTVNAIPTDRVTGFSMATTTVIDVIEPRGYFELSLFDAPATVLDASTIQVGAGPSLSRIEVGDYVRVAAQTDWPQLPESFHHVVAEATAAQLCLRRDMTDRASSVGAMASANVERLVGHLTPRTKAQTHKPLQHGWR